VAGDRVEGSEAPHHALLEAAMAGDDAGVDAILAGRPECADNVPCAFALADLRVLHGIDRATSGRTLEPYDWPPLLYLCNSRYRARDESNRAARVRIGEALVESGADPNAGMRESETIRGYRTALGAAIGRARSAALAELLLDAGADIADGPTLYEGSAMWEAIRHRDVASLKLLLAADPPQWHVCHALPQCLVFNDVALVRLVLEHGGDPNWTMGVWGFKGNCLHEAVVLDNDPAILEALLSHGAQVEFTDRGGRTPLCLATCLNRVAQAEVLGKHGANDSAIRDVDRWVSACFAGDDGLARRRAQASIAEADHVWLCRAIRDRNDDALRLLLAGGVDPDTVDDDGERALHLAAAMDNAFALQSLLNAGADARATNYAGQTPLDCARQDGEVAAMLTSSGASRHTARYDEPGLREVFERAADAVVDGDIPTLKSLLNDHPELATARSARPHRCTLLHYLGANGVEGERQKTPPNAVLVIELLLAAGADPNASCYTYRGGPDETTVGLLTSSGHPRDAGLTVSMVDALAQGGARVDDVYRLLAKFAAGQTANEIPGFDPTSDLAERAVVESAGLRETRILFALLDAGVDVNARRPDGATSLHQAAIDGDAALVEALLERGADPSLRDAVYDGPAAGWAYAGGHEELGEFLAERTTGS